MTRLSPPVDTGERLERLLCKEECFIVRMRVDSNAGNLLLESGRVVSLSNLLRKRS